MGVRVALAFAILVAVAVGGCGGDDPSPTAVPTVPPPSGSSSSVLATTPAGTIPAPTPTMAPPTLPALARQDSPAGAESFARYWLMTLDYAYKTGDTQPFRALGSCRGCADLMNKIDKLYVDGGTVTGGQLTILETRVDRHVRASAAAVELFYSRSRRIVIDGAGEQYTDPAAARLGFFLILQRLGDRWQVERFPVLDD